MNRNLKCLTVFEDPFSKYDKKFAEFEPLSKTDNIISVQCRAKFSESDDEIQWKREVPAEEINQLLKAYRNIDRTEYLKLPGMGVILSGFWMEKGEVNYSFKVDTPYGVLTLRAYQQLNLSNVKSAEILSEWLEITDI